ncbi:hypothetical protein QT974_01955 [Microcoleus sp. herbarium12]
MPDQTQRRSHKQPAVPENRLVYSLLCQHLPLTGPQLTHKHSNLLTPKHRVSVPASKNFNSALWQIVRTAQFLGY